MSAADRMKIEFGGEGQSSASVKDGDGNDYAPAFSKLAVMLDPTEGVSVSGMLALSDVRVLGEGEVHAFCWNPLSRKPERVRCLVFEDGSCVDFMKPEKKPSVIVLPFCRPDA